MSDINGIPEMVQPDGPMFLRLPIELILRIFEIYMKSSPVLKPNRIVDKKLFDILNIMNYLDRLRRVNKLFYIVAMQVFYSGNQFLFKSIEAPKGRGPLTLLHFPPMQYRHFLRRIKVRVYLPLRNWMSTVEQLMKHCQGARVLRNLTDATTGYPCLVHLDLGILVDYWVSDGPQPVLDVFKEAAFVVRARKVVVSAKGLVKYDGQETEGTDKPFPELAKLVTVELVE
jgi:hypothetical protein